MPIKAGPSGCVNEMVVKWDSLQTVLVIDTESYIDMQSGQRRLLALAFELINCDSGEVAQCGYNIILPRDAYRPDARSGRVHGLTPVAVSNGDDVVVVLDRLTHMMGNADALVAHDITADVGVLVTEAVAVSHHSALQSLTGIVHVCTKVESTAICSIAMPSIAAWKWPALRETVQMLLGEDMDRSTHHSCPDDVRMCARVFMRLYYIHAH